MVESKPSCRDCPLQMNLSWGESSRHLLLWRGAVETHVQSCTVRSSCAYFWSRLSYLWSSRPSPSDRNSVSGLDACSFADSAVQARTARSIPL